MADNSKKIIIVDDDEDLMRLLIAAFKTKGFKVHPIMTGAEALTYLLNDENMRSASLLILDRVLPDMDGLDILRQIQEKSHIKIPIIILSVLSSEHDMIEGLKKGAIEYIKKPFSLPVLIEKALSIISR